MLTPDACNARRPPIVAYPGAFEPAHRVRDCLPRTGEAGHNDGTHPARVPLHPANAGSTTPDIIRHPHVLSPRTSTECSRCMRRRSTDTSSPRTRFRHRSGSDSRIWPAGSPAGPSCRGVSTAPNASGRRATPRATSTRRGRTGNAAGSSMAWCGSTPRRRPTATSSRSRSSSGASCGRRATST